MATSPSRLSLWAAEPPIFGPADPVGVLTVVPQLTLDEIRDRELTGGENTRALGAWSASAMPSETAFWRAQVRRVIPAVWRLRQSAQSFELPRVSLELLAPDGTPGRLLREGQAQGFSEIRVSLRPLPPTIVERDAETIVIEGGAELSLDLSKARMAGRYSGALVVTLHHF
jgi:hypothetical protein